ncbi:MAG: DUF350 domain-containing protein [Hamadaea sp.]|uniref:DUF350 domain-containing protein n=1 Tax=Hamadaea sp. NPDC050747 TaxID=3155789 RepID=UPI00184EE01C|nr:DUF350 domain-containing protein [Hamadaea sp.]NUR51081.1 DUF350 domain-containing protein [Hamadaea sp.]NUT05891.1 DUF350 domain-containing protein [Hamadaea sp.]
MSDVLDGLVGSVAFTAVGVLLLLGGFLLVDWLTPGPLRHQIWSERNRNAALFLASALVGVGAIAFTSILTTYAEFWVGLVSTAVYGTLGLLLMAGAFWLLDLLTPGKLGEMIVDPEPHPAVWVSAASNAAIAAIVCAAIS